MKLAMEVLRQTLYEFSLTLCIHNPDDLPGADRSPRGGPGGPGYSLPRLLSSNDIPSLA